jgi:NAD(P)H-dependent FMN reductase
LLGISGSLRADSTNARLLGAARALLRSGASLSVSSYPGRLPLFNPDFQARAPAPVADWVAEMKAADGLVISTPEYARGYPGALKNAFDWLVDTDAHVNKPFMLLNANARSRVAQETFTVVLETMSGIHIEGASVTIPLLGTTLSVSDIVAHPEFASSIRGSLERFIEALEVAQRP